jgi:hypothetical protein
MKVSGSDRRVAWRLNFKAPLRVRIWKSVREQTVESENLSETGTFFAFPGSAGQDP